MKLLPTVHQKKTSEAVSERTQLIQFLSGQETRQKARSNALSFLQAMLPEELGLLHRGGEGGGDCQRVRGEGR